MVGFLLGKLKVWQGCQDCRIAGLQDCRILPKCGRGAVKLDEYDLCSAQLQGLSVYLNGILNLFLSFVLL
jgi:hypothetical protein